MSFWADTVKRFTSKEWKAETDLGNVLIKMGILKEHDLLEAVKRQKDMELRTRLGQILVDMGCITKEQLDTALNTQRLLRKGHHGTAMVQILNDRADAKLKELRTVPER